MRDRLEDVFARISRREQHLPGLAHMRVDPLSPETLDAIKDDWPGLPGDVLHLMEHGGWWPGKRFELPEDNEPYFVWTLSSELEDMTEYPFRWPLIGCTWEKDVVFVPVARDGTAHATAPIGMWSVQMLTACVAAPSLADFLEVFIVALDNLAPVEADDPWWTMGSTWVDLIGAGPDQGLIEEVGAERARTARREIVELVAAWSSDHPCWHPDLMPFGWSGPVSEPLTNALFYGISPNNQA